VNPINLCANAECLADISHFLDPTKRVCRACATASKLKRTKREGAPAFNARLAAHYHAPPPQPARKGLGRGRRR